VVTVVTGGRQLFPTDNHTRQLTECWCYTVTHQNLFIRTLA
jgi:hypothetical protein